MCTDALSCYKSTCVKGICVGASHGGSCTSTFNCDPGLMCDVMQGVCVSLGGSGSPCASMWECENEHGCANGKCVEFVSLNLGEYCYADYFCKSYHCQDNVCLNPPKSVSMPMSCTANTNCTSAPFNTTDGLITIQGVCSCGQNPSGTAYCSLFHGDSLY
jgi:hypothetical protein